MAEAGVDVVMPFAGGVAEAREAIAALAPLVPAAASVTLVDNSREGSATALAVPGVTVLTAGRLQGSYYARNVGAGAGSAEWLLFIDSDCRPPAGLIAAYLEPEPAAGVGILAGAVRPAPATSRAARYAASRGEIDERFHLEHGPRPAGVTANLIVRRAAFDAVGGFEETVRSGGDVDFCWRVQEAGFSLEHRPAAVLEHDNPDSVARLAAKARRHAAGRAWVNQRWGEVLPRPRLARPFLRGPLVAAYWAAQGDRERAAFKLIDMRLAGAALRGYWAGDNGAAAGSGSDRA